LFLKKVSRKKKKREREREREANRRVLRREKKKYTNGNVGLHVAQGH
jgi:hypothetical protein